MSDEKKRELQVTGYVQAFVVGPDSDLDAEPEKGFRAHVAFVPLSRKAELEGEYIHILQSLQHMAPAIFWYDDSKAL